MSIRERIRRLILGPEEKNKPACPGCGRPVGSPGDVCASCRNEQTQEPGG